MPRFIAMLSGAEEVPPVQTMATGDTEFHLNEAQTELRYTLRVRNIQRVTEAHIHLGMRGENGPVVVFLWGPARPGMTLDNGTVTGVIRENDFVGPLQGQPFSELIRHMVNRNTYVNVHTERNPAGEIRGQIRRVDNNMNHNNMNNNGSNSNYNR